MEGKWIHQKANKRRKQNLVPNLHPNPTLNGIPVSETLNQELFSKGTKCPHIKIQIIVKCYLLFQASQVAQW